MGRMIIMKNVNNCINLVISHIKKFVNNSILVVADIIPTKRESLSKKKIIFVLV